MRKAIFGYGGHALEISMLMGVHIFFVDDKYLNTIIKKYDDVILPISKFDPNEYELMIAVGDPQLKREIIYRLPNETKYFSYCHPTSIIYDESIRIGIGTFIGPGTILTTDITIGNHVTINRGNQLGHGSHIGDYSSIMPGAVISGDCNIGEAVFIGTLASIKEKTTINNNIIIGMGSVVTKSLYEMGTYVGVPAKALVTS